MPTAEVIAGDKYVHPIKKDGDTFDIIHGIMEADKCNAAYIPDGTELLGPTKYQTCKNIFDFVTSHIPYNEDKEGEQLIQSPGELWNNRYRNKIDLTGEGGTGKGGDCKSMALMCAAILKSQGNFEFAYRFVSEFPDDELYHVYIIVRDDTGEGYITLDCTLKTFDKELKLAKLLDVDPNGPDAACPFPAKQKRVRVGAPYTVNDTAEENSGAIWATHEFSFKQQYAMNSAYLNQLKAQLINDIEIHFQGHPLKQQKAQAFINDYWTNHVKTASLMIYHFWGDTSLQLNDFAGKPIPPLSSVDIWIGQTEITIKEQNGNDYYDDLKNIGITDDHLKQLIKLSVFNNHGITLDYMLYRCYNKLTYGQEWGPIPGIPFYNANEKKFYPNGATDDEIINLINAFPLEGGTGKPWGMPYIARGIFIMTNGANDVTLKALTDAVNLHGWTWYINHFVKPGSTENWDDRTISDEEINAATDMYYQWQQGQLPVLYANPVSATSITLNTGLLDPFTVNLAGPRIGITEAMATLIAAIIVAFVQLVGAILAFVLTMKANKAKLEAKPPVAPLDFKLQYQSADGCAIGYTSSCPSGVGKLCKTGFTCITDLTLPENQPVNNDFNPLDPNDDKNKKMLALGLGAIALLALSSGND